MYKIYDIVVAGDRTEIYINEVLSLLNAYKIPFDTIGKIPKILRIKIPVNVFSIFKDIISKSSAVKLIIEEKFFLNDIAKLNETILSVDWSDLSDKSFKIFFYKIGKKEIHFSQLMKKILFSINSKIGDKVSIDLYYPEIKIIVVSIDSTNLIIGKLVEKFRGDRFKFRDPLSKIFRHPSMLTAKDARLLYNLSLKNPCEKNVFLDPFAGTGSILIESGIEKSFSVGVEIRKDIFYNTLKNIKEYNLQAYTDLVNADSTMLPFREKAFDNIATDPPYGRLASISIQDNCVFLKKFIEESCRVLKENSKISIMYTSKYRNCLLESLKKRNMTLKTEYSFTIHDELTRIILVAEKYD